MHTKRQTKYRFPLLLLLVLILTGSSFKRADMDEYEVKAMFLINFVKYVDWGMPDEKTPIRIGIVGQSDIVHALERIAEYKKGHSRPIEILQVDPSHPTACNLIFIAASETRRAAGLAHDLAGHGVLIVTEDNNSSSRAAGINLVRSDNRIKFVINQAAVKLAGLRLSMQLQQLASTLNP